MRTRNWWCRLMIFGLFFVLAIGFSPSVDRCLAAEVQQYQIVAASMGGAIYRWCAAFSKVFNEQVKGAQFVVRTGSPPENILMVETGEVPLAGTSAGYYKQVHPDNPDFRKSRVRTVWEMFCLYRYLVVPADSPYRTYDDLKGKKIAVGIKTAEGGDFLEMVKALGWKDKDIKFYYIGKNEGMTAYKDGTVDAWTGWSTVPSPHLMQLASSRRGARVIPFSRSEIETIEKVNMAYSGDIIPAGSSKDIEKDIPTISYWLELIARDDFPEDVAYQIADAIDHHLKDVIAVFKGARDATAENTVKHHAFQLHPGTVKYLKEKGLM